ncbi:disease resistance protein Pik-2-like isoform X2 [Miscanthus floridulus]
MEFATGALGTLLPKLGQLLQDEYNLHKGVKKDIVFVTRELESMRAALRDVGEVPQAQLKEAVKIWARDVRELSYDMEDIVDTFLVRVPGSEPPSKRSIKRFIKKMTTIVGKAQTLHEIGQAIKDIKERVKDVAERRDRYKVDAITPTKTSVDPRITALYTKAASLVGIDEPREELISRLTREHGGMSSAEQRIVTIVGFGGLGKTTLAKAVYDKLKPQFNCTAFVSVSRDPDIMKVLKDILYELDKKEYKDIHNTALGQQHLTDLVHEFLKHKR